MDKVFINDCKLDYLLRRQKNVCFKKLAAEYQAEIIRLIASANNPKL